MIRKWVVLMACVSVTELYAQEKPFDWHWHRIPGSSVATNVIVVLAPAARSHATIEVLPEILGIRDPSIIAYAVSGKAPDTPTVAASIRNDSYTRGRSFSSSRYVPKGLLITNGKLRSELEAIDDRPDDQCPQENQKESWAVVCIRGGAITLPPVEASTAWQTSCEHAAQAGRYLVQNRKPRECRVVSRPISALFDHYRTAICIRGNKDVLLVMSKGATIGELAAWLAKGAKDNGVGCETAAELARGHAANLGLFGTSDPTYDGAASAHSPVAIVIKSRR